MKINVTLFSPIVVVAFLAVILVGSKFELPSMQTEFAQSAAASKDVDLIVDGLRCRGTSNFFTKVVGEVPGVVSVTTFVQEHRATISYDPGQIDPEGIAQAVDAPITLPDGRVVTPFKVAEIRK